jgi:hypothetical protein
MVRIIIRASCLPILVFLIFFSHLTRIRPTAKAAPDHI